MLLSAYIDHYGRTRDVSAGYVAQLRVAASTLETHVGTPLHLDDVASEIVNAWLAALLATRARDTARSKRGALLTILAGAVADGFLAAMPKGIRVIRRRDRLIDGYSAEDMRRLIGVAAKMPGRFLRLKVARAVWWPTFLRVAWSTGLRLGDVLSLPRSAIGPGGRIYIVQRKTGGALMRQLSAAALDGVAEIARQSPGHEFAVPPYCRRKLFYRHFRRLATAAGLGGTARWIRRGSASEVEKEHPGCGWKHLGHAAPGLAERSYLVPRIVGERIIGPPEV